MATSDGFLGYIPRTVVVVDAVVVAGGAVF